MSLDLAFWIASIVAEGALIGVLVRNRVYRQFPSFFIFICWSQFSDLAGFAMQRWIPLGSVAYFRLYEVLLVIDSALIFAVLVELAWSVLRPVRSSLPRRSWIAIAVLIALAGMALWPVAGFTVPGNLTVEGNLFFRLQQTFAILRVVIFLSMACFSQLLSIGWRDRELQVATGLGFYSIVSLAVTVVHTHQVVSTAYHWLDQMGNLSYLGSLSYWVLVFSTKEAERRNFSPQMVKYLLLVGNNARESRAEVTDMVITNARSKDER